MSAFSKVFNKKPTYKTLATVWRQREKPMALSIIFTTYTSLVFKNSSERKPLYYAKIILKKGQVFKCWKDSGVKVWLRHFK